MRYAQITDGVVTGLHVTSIAPSPEWIPAPPEVGLGWALDGDTWTPPAPPPPAPLALTRLAFVRLGQTAGGMTDAQLVEARANPMLAALWIKLDLAAEIERDDPDAQAAVAALDAMGYLPNGASAVIAAWPVV